MLLRAPATRQSSLETVHLNEEENVGYDNLDTMDGEFAWSVRSINDPKAMESSAPTRNQVASHACSACRKGKRKCDKALPTCSLCARIGRTCDYSDPAPSTQGDLAALQQRIAELENRLSQDSQKPLSNNGSTGLSPYSSTSNGSSLNSSSTAIRIGSLSSRSPSTNPFEDFPALFFIDNDIFSQARLVIPKPTPPITDEIYAILGSVDNIHRIANRYFSSIHTWLPMISKKRLELALSNPEFELHADLALLISCMHLISDETAGGTSTVRNPTYWTLKSTAATLESIHNILTPALLQSQVLLAAYELGHSIYPAAYLSISHCAALGRIMGISDRRCAPQMLPRRWGAWAEVEEIRRTWWAVLLLDRYVNLGIPGHPLSTEEPARNDLLPSEDARWDEGNMASSEPLYVASPTNVLAGPFARTCQAGHLMGGVVRLLREYMKSVHGAGSNTPVDVVGPPSGENDEARFQECTQLYRTLCAFTKVLLLDSASAIDSFATATALTYGSILHLCDPYSCTESNAGPHSASEAEFQTISIAAMRQTAADVLQWAQNLRESLVRNPNAMSPLICDCIYMGCTTYEWMVYEIGSEEAVMAYRTLKDILRLLNGRWACAGEYLNALNKAKEVLYHNNPLL